MKLTYRGVQYDYNPSTVSYVEVSEVGQYRGRTMHFHRPIGQFPSQPKFDFIYRGAHALVGAY